MNYEERLKKIIGNDDPFWFIVLDEFVMANYADKDLGIRDLEKLAEDPDKFNEFTKQVVQNRDHLKDVYVNYFSFEGYEESEVNPIVSEVVQKIQQLDDEVFTSISAIVKECGYHCDSKELFLILKKVENELKNIGLYLDFSENKGQVVGLPFNSCFKKGYVKQSRK